MTSNREFRARSTPNAEPRSTWSILYRLYRVEHEVDEIQERMSRLYAVPSQQTRQRELSAETQRQFLNASDSISYDLHCLKSRMRHLEEMVSRLAIRSQNHSPPVEARRPRKRVSWWDDLDGITEKKRTVLDRRTSRKFWTFLIYVEIHWEIDRTSKYSSPNTVKLVLEIIFCRKYCPRPIHRLFLPYVQWGRYR